MCVENHRKIYHYIYISKKGNHKSFHAKFISFSSIKTIQTVIVAKEKFNEKNYTWNQHILFGLAKNLYGKVNE